MEQDPNSTSTKQNQRSFIQDKQRAVLSKSDLHEIKILKSIWLPWLPKRHPVDILRRAITEVKANLTTCVSHMHVVKKNPMLTKSRAQRDQRRKELALNGRGRSRGSHRPNKSTIKKNMTEGMLQNIILQDNEKKHVRLKDVSHSETCIKEDFYETSQSQQASKTRLPPCKDRPFLLWSVPKSKLGLHNMKRTDFAPNITSNQDKRQLQVPEWFLNVCANGLCLELRSSYPDDMAGDSEEFTDFLSTPRMLQIEIPSTDHAWGDSRSDMRFCFIILEGLSSRHKVQSGSLEDGDISCNASKLQDGDPGVDMKKSKKQSRRKIKIRNKDKERSLKGTRRTSAASERKQPKSTEDVRHPRNPRETIRTCDKRCESMQLILKNTKDQCALKSTLKPSGCSNHTVKYSNIPRILLRIGGKLQSFSRTKKTSNVDLMADNNNSGVIKPGKVGSQELKFTKRRGHLTNVNATSKFRSSAYTRQSKNSNNSALTHDSVYMEYADNQVVVTSDGVVRNSDNQDRPSDRGWERRKPARTKLKSRRMRRQTVNFMNPNLTAKSFVTHAAKGRKRRTLPYTLEPVAFRVLRAKLHDFVRQEWCKANYVLNTNNPNVYSYTDEDAHQNLSVRQTEPFVHLDLDSCMKTWPSCFENEEVGLNAQPYRCVENDGLNLNCYPVKDLKDDADKEEMLVEEVGDATWNDILKRSKSNVRYENQSTLSISTEDQNLHYDSEATSRCTPSKHPSLCQQCDDECSIPSYSLNEASCESFGSESASDWYQNSLFYKTSDWANRISSENSNSFCDDSLNDVHIGWASRLGFEINVNSSSKPTKVIPKKPTTTTTTTKIATTKKVNNERKVNKGKLPLTGPVKRLHSNPQQKVKAKAETSSANDPLISPSNSSTKSKRMVDSAQCSASPDFNCRGPNLKPADRQSACKGDNHSITDFLNRTARVTIVEDTEGKHSQRIASQCRGNLELESRRQRSSLSMNCLPTTDLKASYDCAKVNRPEIGVRPNSVRPTFSSKYSNMPKAGSLSQVRDPYSSVIFPPQGISTDRNTLPIRRSSTEGQRHFINSGSCDPQGDTLSHDIQNDLKREGHREVLSPSGFRYQNHSRRTIKNSQNYAQNSHNRYGSSLPTDGLFQHNSNISCAKDQDPGHISVAAVDPLSLSLNRDCSSEQGTRPKDPNFLQTVSQTDPHCVSGGIDSPGTGKRNETGHVADGGWRARATRPCRFPKSVASRYKSCYAVRDDKTSVETERLPSPERIMQFQLQLLSCIHQILATGLAQSTGNTSSHGNRHLNWPLHGNTPLPKPKVAWMADNEIIDLLNNRTPTDVPYKNVLRNACTSRGFNSLKDAKKWHHCNGRSDLQYSSLSRGHKRSPNLDTGVNAATHKRFRYESFTNSPRNDQKRSRFHSPDIQNSRSNCLSRKSDVETGMQTRPPNNFQEESIICGMSPGRSEARWHESSEISDMSCGRNCLKRKDQPEIRSRLWPQKNPPSYCRSSQTSITRNYPSSLKWDSFHPGRSYHREEKVKVNKKCQVGGSRIKSANLSQFPSVEAQSKEGRPCPTMKDSNVRCGYTSDGCQAVESTMPNASQPGSSERHIRRPCRSKKPSKCRYHRDDYFKNNDTLDSYCTTTSDSLKTGSEREHIGQLKYCDELTNRSAESKRKSCPKDRKVASDKFNFQEDMKKSARSPIIHIRYRSRKNPTDKEDYPPNAGGSFNGQKITLETELGKTLAKVIKRSLQLQNDISRLEENQASSRCPESETNSKPTSSYDFDSLLDMPAIISYDNTNCNAKCSEPGPGRHKTDFKLVIDSRCQGKSGAGNNSQAHPVDFNDNSKDRNRGDKNSKNARQRSRSHHGKTFHAPDKFPLPFPVACAKQRDTRHHFKSTILHAHPEHGHPSAKYPPKDFDNPTSHINDTDKLEAKTNFAKHSESQRHDGCTDTVKETSIMQNPRLSKAPCKQKNLKKLTGWTNLSKNQKCESAPRHHIVGRRGFIHEKAFLTDGDPSQNHPQKRKSISRRQRKQSTKILSRTSEDLSQSHLDSKYWSRLWDMNSVGQAKTFLSQKKDRHKTPLNDNIPYKLISKPDKAEQSTNFDSKSTPTRTFVHAYNTELVATEDQETDVFYQRLTMTGQREKTADGGQKNDAMSWHTVDIGLPRNSHSETLPPAIKMDAWSEKELPKDIGVPSHERANQCLNKSVNEDEPTGLESDSKSSTHGIEGIPFDTEADPCKNARSHLWERHAAADSRRQSSTMLYSHVCEDSSSDKCHPISFKGSNEAKGRKTKMESRSHLGSTFCGLNHQIRDQEPESNGEKGRLDEDESTVYLTPGRGSGLKIYQNIHCRRQIAERETPDFHTDNKMVDGVLNISHTCHTNSTASIIISNLVEAETSCNATNTQMINTSDLLTVNNQNPNQTSKETQFPNEPPSLSKHVSDECQRRETNLQKAIIQWWNYPEVDIIVSPTLIHHERDVSVSRPSNEFELIDQVPGREMTSQTMKVISHGLYNSSGQNQSRQQASLVYQDLDIPRSKGTLPLMADDAEGQNSSSTFGDLERELHLGECVEPNSSKHHDNKSGSSSSHSVEKTDGSLNFGSSSTEIKTVQAMTQSDSFDNSHLPLVGFGHMIEANEKRVALEGAFYRRSSSSSFAFNENGNQNVLRFRIVIIRRRSKAGRTKAVIGTYRREMETSRRQLTWRFQACIQDVPLDTDAI